jgi:hypothetical protein
LSVNGQYGSQLICGHDLEGAGDDRGLSTYVALAPGDLIFTGTPSGVGPIAPGETLRGSIGALASIEVCFGNDASRISDLGR